MHLLRSYTIPNTSSQYYRFVSFSPDLTLVVEIRSFVAEKAVPDSRERLMEPKLALITSPYFFHNIDCYLAAPTAVSSHPSWHKTKLLSLFPIALCTQHCSRRVEESHLFLVKGCAGSMACVIPPRFRASSNRRACERTCSSARWNKTLCRRTPKNCVPNE